MVTRARGSKIIALRDQDGTTSIVRRIELTQADSDGVVVSDEGRGDARRVVVENSNGRLMCHVWASADADEPEYSIELKQSASAVGRTTRRARAVKPRPRLTR